jgi:hypothetical protein
MTVQDLFYYSQTAFSDICTLKSYLNAGHHHSITGIVSGTYSERYME